MDDLAALDRSLLWHPFTQHQVWLEPLVIASGEGAWLVDTDGRRYVDGVSSLWTNVHGHRHPHVDAAIRRQLDRIAHSTLLGLTHEPAIRLAGRLVEIAPKGLARVFYSDDGSTAVEVALKIAFQFHQQTGATRRTRFACLSDAYHGDTLGAVSIGAIDRFHALYRPLLFDAVVLPAPKTAGGDEEASCLAHALEKLDTHRTELAAVVFEPLVQGAAGMKHHSVGYLRALLERGRAHGALLVADEVAVGFGRLGTMFAMEQVGLSPDLLCLAKGITGGYLPLAATLATEALFDAFLAEPNAYRQLFHGHTYTGNPLACAAALASLEVFDRERTLDHVREVESVLAERLGRIARHPAVRGVRHRGVLVGIDLPTPDHALRVATACRRHGAIVRPLGDVLVLNPPLAIPHDALATLVDAVDRAMADVFGPT
jgi:adenosylmethionine-8-amino-7-oxononanoate aminotransferase